MTKQELEKVITIMRTADGNCLTCANKLLEKLKAAFPKFDSEIKLEEE